MSRPLKQIRDAPRPNPNEMPSLVGHPLEFHPFPLWQMFRQDENIRAYFDSWWQSAPSGSRTPLQLFKHATNCCQVFTICCDTFSEEAKLAHDRGVHSLWRKRALQECYDALCSIYANRVMYPIEDYFAKEAQILNYICEIVDT